MEFKLSNLAFCFASCNGEDKDSQTFLEFFRNGNREIGNDFVTFMNLR